MMLKGSVKLPSPCLLLIFNIIHHTLIVLQIQRTLANSSKMRYIKSNKFKKGDDL